eukprot:scpid80813/ scgid12631/ 
MARAIRTSYRHTFSTDDSPKHEFCPTGVDSWWKWRKAEATGTPFSHSKNIPPAVKEAVKPVYVRLTDKSLLERCTRGATQNANEALNGLIWYMCPKRNILQCKSC